MTNLALNQFGGMVPRLGDQKINNTSASFAENALLLSGEVRGIRSQSVIQDLRNVPYPIGRFYRVLDNSDNTTTWVTFDHESVDMVKAPMVNDAHDRYYYTSEVDVPRMNTLSRFESGSEGFLWGIPIPELPQGTEPMDISVGTGTGDIVTRAYIYTYQSFYGEEGPPCDAVVAEGPHDATWTLTFNDLPVDNNERNLTTRRIYRTVTSSAGTVEYHHVADIPLDDVFFADDITTLEVSANFTFYADHYDPPPEDMIGVVSHPNGFLVGFSGNNLYFSEPYRPHAWPVKYQQAVDSKIVGLGVYATSIAVCTVGHPYVSTGVHPAAMALTKAQTPNPCISTRRGIVPMPFGVYYPSDTGLILVSSGGFQNATKPLLTKTEWTRDYFPSEITAVRWQSQYVAFYASGDGEGFMFAPDEPQAAFVELRGPWNHNRVQNDTLTSDVLMVRDNVVRVWNPPYGIPVSYIWRSKEYVTPRPVNFGALAIEFGAPREVSEEISEEFQQYNDARYAYPLNPLNFRAINRVTKIEEITGNEADRPIVAENKLPMHESSLYKTGAYGGGGGSLGVQINAVPKVSNVTATNSEESAYNGELAIQIYADGRQVFGEIEPNVPALNIYDEQCYRLPRGYKARRWIIELKGTVDVASVKLAETASELAQI